MLHTIKKVLKTMPVISGLIDQRRLLQEENSWLREENKNLHQRLENRFDLPRFVESGHFYSPIPSILDIQRDEAVIFEEPPKSIRGVDLNESEQLALLEQLRGYYAELPFADQKRNGTRYFFENPFYSYSDAIFLYCMIRHLRPRRIIEVGSGYSSCVTLDTNDLFFKGSIQTVFIEPNPERLMSLLTNSDKDSIRLIPQRLQDVDLHLFEELTPNDILFIDSSHVSKIHSDVNRIFFQILPVLAPGVYIHFHDIIYPFEYPKSWIYEGRFWTEAYLLKGFLQYNSSFRIALMNTFLEHFHREWFQREMPLCLKNPGGSIWVRRF